MADHSNGNQFSTRRDQRSRPEASGSPEGESGARRPGMAPIGPDQGTNLRTLRPYFLVPVLGAHPGEDSEQLLDRIRRWAGGGDGQDPADRTPNGQGGGPITDIFIYAHGWHENFFRATSVYDRLTSRMGHLRYSGRLNPPGDFRPLYLNLHYHSDPGSDTWKDRCGRRTKDSFLAGVRKRFEPASDDGADPCFTRDFEQIFAFFTHVASPGAHVDTSAIPGLLDPDPNHLGAILHHYHLKEAPDAPLPDRVAMAWSCYHEAEQEPVLQDQDEQRRRFLSPIRAAATLLRFFAQAIKPGRLLILALILLFFFRKRAGAWLLGVWRTIINAFDGGPLQIFGGAGKFILSLVFFLALISWLCLWIASKRPQSREKAEKGAPPPVVISWFILQILLSIPLLFDCLFTFMFGAVVPHPWLFDERFGKRDEDPDQAPRKSPRYVLAQIAQYPATLLRRTAGEDSHQHAIADKADAQLSFWTMQRRSVEAGEAGAGFVAELLATIPEVSTARIHLLGHSFGVLIVPNLVRHLVLSSRLRSRWEGAFRGCFQSLCLLGAAFASNWFERERKLRSSILSIGCIYSRYDSANGFYYPFSNHGRVAAGYVGLYGDFETEEKGGYVALAGPPDLGHSLEDAQPRVINVDASRILYRGKGAPGSDPKDVFRVGSGGSHDDIFNDDAMYLAWAVTGLEQPGEGRCGGGAQNTV